MKNYWGFGGSLAIVASLGFLATGCIASTDGVDESRQGAAESAPGETPEAVSEATSAVSASVCGSGYKLVGVEPLLVNGPTALTKPKEPVGELEVFYNASTGRNCLVLQALGKYYGMKKRMFVRVCNHEMDFNTKDCMGEKYDGGDFKYYAGPVYITAPHQCIYYSSGIYEPNSTMTYVAFGKDYCG